MTTILIGYSGDISKSIFQVLQNKTDQLIVVTRERSSASQKIDSNLKFFEHDITENPLTIEHFLKLNINPAKLNNLIFTSSYQIGQKNFKSLSVPQLKKLINGNLTNCLITIQNFLKYRTSVSKGTIITFGSQAVVLGGNNISVYSCAKGAIETFTKAVAKEFVDENIRITCLSPFLVNSEPLKLSLKNAPDRERREKLAAQPEQVARLVLNLINEDGFAYSGAIIPITNAR